MKIKYKILLGMWIITGLLAFAFSCYLYTRKKSVLLEGIDDKLFTSAVMLRAVVGEDYHDDLNRDSFTPGQYDRIIVARNNKFCKMLGLQYLWSTMVVGNNIVFTSSTSPGFDISRKDHAGFFSPHSDPHAFDEVFRTMMPVFSSFRNEWGHGRMVLVPYTDKNGRPYVFGASIGTNEIYRALRKTGIDALGFCIIILLLGTLMASWMSNSLSRPIESLSETANTMSGGTLDVTIDEKLLERKDEIGDLARDFQLMITSLESVTASRDELDREIAERKRTEAALERSNEDLRHFAYVASHDLREPLRSISAFLQLLRKRYDSVLDDEGKSFIERAVTGADRLKTLIQSLLKYSRLSTHGKDHEPVACEHVLEFVENCLEAAINESGAVITHDPLPTVTGDYHQLVQLFLNLVSNGLKFCRDRTPAIHVGADPVDGGWKFSVKDNGIGIAPEHHEQIFQIFKRLHSRRSFTGTGIGLAICKRIVERHGGTITVESTEGEGTTFYFTISS